MRPNIETFKSLLNREKKIRKFKDLLDSIEIKKKKNY